MEHRSQAKTVAIHCPPFLQGIGHALYGNDERTWVTFTTAFALMGAGVWLSHAMENAMQYGVCGF